MLRNPGLCEDWPASSPAPCFAFGRARRQFLNSPNSRSTAFLLSSAGPKTPAETPGRPRFQGTRMNRRELTDAAVPTRGRRGLVRPRSRPRRRFGRGLRDRPTAVGIAPKVIQKKARRFRTTSALYCGCNTSRTEGERGPGPRLSTDWGPPGRLEGPSEPTGPAERPGARIGRGRGRREERQAPRRASL